MRSDLAPPRTGALPVLAGVDHLALTVSDLDVSERFYCEVLGFVVVMDVGSARVCMHPTTGLVMTLVTHEGGHGAPFSELHTGADHIGLAVGSREELEVWQQRFEDQGVTYTPIRDETFGAHLNFRDPDGIALELTSGNALMRRARDALASGPMTALDIAAFVAEHVSPDFVAMPHGEPPHAHGAGEGLDARGARPMSD